MEQPIDLEERFEALQDELNLLKPESTEGHRWTA